MSKQPKKVRYIPGDMNYRWNHDNESPFLKRGMINFSYDAKSKANLIKLQQQYYDLLFKNEKEPFLSRNQVNSYDKELKPPKDPRFMDETALVGNTRQMRFTLGKIIRRLIETLEKDPQTLFEESKKISELCAVVNIEIQPIETFNRLSSWEEFMELLKSLEKKDYKFKFELLIAAITQYAALCS